MSTPPRYEVKMKWTEVKGTLRMMKYPDGNNALQIMDKYGPETLSINLGAYNLNTPEGHIFVKDYSEHEGLPDALVEAGVVEKVSEVTFGYGTGWLCKVIGKVVKS